MFRSMLISFHFIDWCIIKNSLVVFLIPSVHGWKVILVRWKGLNEKLKFEVNLPREIKDFYSEEKKIGKFKLR